MQESQIGIKFPILLSTQYLDVLNRANGQVRTLLKPPAWKTYQVRGVSAYPTWFNISVITMLVCVLIFSFVVSAGKQAAALGLVLDPLPSKFNHLSDGWSTLSIGMMLLLGEVGTLLFLIAAGTISQNAATLNLRGWSINPVSFVLHSFALLCAAFAIVGNATITALDYVYQASVLQVLVTVGIPSIVLGLGLILERIIVDALRSNGENRLRFEKAQYEYEQWVDDPSVHPSFPAILSDLLYQEMLKVRGVQVIIKQLIDTDPRYKRWLVSMEYKTHQETSQIDLNVDISAFLPLPVIQPQLASKAVSSGASMRQKDTGALRRAAKWLEKHPEHGLSIRGAADKAGVSSATMQRAMKGEVKS